MRRDADQRVEEQHLSTEEARRRAEIAEARNAEGQNVEGAHSTGRTGDARVADDSTSSTRELPREPRA